MFGSADPDLVIKLIYAAIGGLIGGVVGVAGTLASTLLTSYLTTKRSDTERIARVYELAGRLDAIRSGLDSEGPSQLDEARRWLLERPTREKVAHMMGHLQKHVEAVEKLEARSLELKSEIASSRNTYDQEANRAKELKELNNMMTFRIKNLEEQVRLRGSKVPP